MKSPLSTEASPPVHSRPPSLSAILHAAPHALAGRRGGSTPHRCLALFPEVRRIDEAVLPDVFRWLDATRDVVRVVQIGANDGLRDDPIHAFAACSARWRGVLVEPLPHLCARLRKNYRANPALAFEQTLISDARGHATIHYVDPAEKNLPHAPPAFAEGLASLDAAHLVKNLGEAWRPFIRAVTSETITLGDLFQRHAITALDLLIVDTEGHDYRILRQLDLSAFRPTAILVEFKHLGFWETWRLLTKLRGHYVLHATHNDLLAIRRDEWPGLDEPPPRCA